MLASAVLSAAFIAIQPRLLEGRDPAAVTAVQFAGGGLVALPMAVPAGLPHGPASAGAGARDCGAGAGGTLLPFWLFAFGQARVTAELAGAFVNLEPLVGAAVGWLAFGDAASPAAVPRRPRCGRRDPSSTTPGRFVPAPSASGFAAAAGGSGFAAAAGGSGFAAAAGGSRAKRARDVASVTAGPFR